MTITMKTIIFLVKINNFTSLLLWKSLLIKKSFLFEQKWFISLPWNRIYKKKETKILNFPFNFVESFYKDRLDAIDFSQDTNFQQQLINEPLSKDVKKFLLATSDFGKETQGKLDLYLTNNRLNEASLRRRLDPISKSIITNKNAKDLLFKDVKNFI